MWYLGLCFSAEKCLLLWSAGYVLLLGMRDVIMCIMFDGAVGKAGEKTYFTRCYVWIKARVNNTSLYADSEMHIVICMLEFVREFWMRKDDGGSAIF